MKKCKELENKFLISCVYNLTKNSSFNKGGVNMLRTLIDKAQENDNEALMELINRFQPAIRKYALKLNYEDAYEDLVLWFIELVKAQKLADLREEVIVSYINVCIKNYYNKKIEKIIERKKEYLWSDMTEETSYYAEKLLAKEDEKDLFMELRLKEVLNDGELQIIYWIYIEGYSTAEIARLMKKTRQAVNQMKQRAIKKIKEILVDK